VRNGTWELAVVALDRPAAMDRLGSRKAATALHLAELREGIWTRPTTSTQPASPRLASSSATSASSTGAGEPFTAWILGGGISILVGGTPRTSATERLGSCSGSTREPHHPWSAPARVLAASCRPFRLAMTPETFAGLIDAEPSPSVLSRYLAVGAI
jgi:hypothetical protein